MSGITLLVNWKCKGNWHSRKVCVSPHSQYLEGTTVFALNLSYTLYVLLQSRAHKFFYRELPLITIIVSLTFLSTHTVVNLLIWIKKYLKLRQNGQKIMQMRTLEKALWWYTSSLEEKVLSSVLESSCLKEMRSTFVAFFVCLLFSATNAWSSSTHCTL